MSYFLRFCRNMWVICFLSLAICVESADFVAKCSSPRAYAYSCSRNFCSVQAHLRQVEYIDFNRLDKLPPNVLFFSFLPKYVGNMFFVASNLCREC